MKLHLPKALLVALISACATAAWADWGEGDTANTYYITTETVDLVDATSEGKGAAITISPTGEITSSVINDVSIKSGDTLNISANGESNFESLTISSLEIANSGTATFNVGTGQNVMLSGLSGTINSNVAADATMTLSGTIGGTIKAMSGTMQVTGTTSVNEINAGVDGTARGGVVVKENAALTLTKYTNHQSNTYGITVENGATLTTAGLTLTGTTSAASSLAKLKRERNNVGGQYSLNNTDYTIYNGKIAVSEDDKTLTNKLSNVIIEHKTDTTLTIKNEANVITTIILGNGSTSTVGTGNGVLNIGAAANITKVEAWAGTLNINATGVSIETLDAGGGGKARGHIVIGEGAALSVTQLYNNTEADAKCVTLKNNATLTTDGLVLKGTGATEETYATIKRTGGTDGLYTKTHTGYTISNGQISVANGGTINNILSNVDVLHETNNTLTISNENSDLNTVTVNQGTVNLASLKSDADVTATIAEAGTLALSGSVGALTATGEGVVVVNSGATLSGESAISTGMQLNATLSNTGTFTYGGSTIEVPHLMVLEYDDTITYSAGDNGYAQGKFYLVQSTGDGATATVTTENLTLDGYAVQGSGTSSLYVEADGTKGSYYVNNGKASYNSETATTALVMNGGTLNLNAALASGVDICTSSDTAKVINVGEGVILANSDVKVNDGTKSALAGGTTAVYNMGAAKLNGQANSANNETKFNVTVGDNWQGTVVFAQGTVIKDNNFDFNDFGVAGSTIQFNGTSNDSYLGTVAANDAPYAANIELKGDGFTIGNGFGGTTYTFTGAFKGDGTFKMNKSGLAGGLKFNFAGDMSQWQGELKQSAAANDSYSYTFSQNATNIANKVTAEAGTMVVNVDNSEAVSMTGDVSATGGTMNLTKSGDSKLTVNKLSANGGNVVLSGTANNAIEVGTMSIASGNTVTGTADVTVTDKLAIAAENKLAINGALTMGDNVTIDLTGLTITDGQTSYTLATASNGVSLQNYTITGLDLTGTMYEGYRMTISAMDSNAAAGIALLADEGNTHTNALVLTLSQDVVGDATLTATGVSYDAANNILTLGTGLTKDTFTLETVEDAVVGAELWQEAIDAIVGAEGGAAEVSVQFTYDGGNEVIDLEALGVQNLTINGNAAVGGTATIEGGTASAYLIPEPTSTTLSLLALAALAVRRRRK